MNSLPSLSLGYCFLFLCVLSPYSPADTARKIVDTGNKMNGRDWMCTGQENAAMLGEGDTRCLQCIVSPEQDTSVAISVGNAVQNPQTDVGTSTGSSVSECFIAAYLGQEWLLGEQHVLLEPSALPLRAGTYSKLYGRLSFISALCRFSTGDRK